MVSLYSSTSDAWRHHALAGRRYERAPCGVYAHLTLQVRVHLIPGAWLTLVRAKAARQPALGPVVHRAVVVASDRVQGDELLLMAGCH